MELIFVGFYFLKCICFNIGLFRVFWCNFIVNVKFWFLYRVEGVFGWQEVGYFFEGEMVFYIEIIVEFVLSVGLVMYGVLFLFLGWFG